MAEIIGVAVRHRPFDTVFPTDWGVFYRSGRWRTYRYNCPKTVRNFLKPENLAVVDKDFTRGQWEEVYEVEFVRKLNLDIRWIPDCDKVMKILNSKENHNAD